MKTSYYSHSSQGLTHNIVRDDRYDRFQLNSQLKLAFLLVKLGLRLVERREFFAAEGTHEYFKL
jgi:hypothetical protein